MALRNIMLLLVATVFMLVANNAIQVAESCDNGDHVLRLSPEGPDPSHHWRPPVESGDNVDQIMSLEPERPDPAHHLVPPAESSDDVMPLGSGSSGADPIHRPCPSPIETIKRRVPDDPDGLQRLFNEKKHRSPEH